MKIKQQVRSVQILRLGGWVACVALLFLVGLTIFPPKLADKVGAVGGTSAASESTLTLDLANDTTKLNLKPTSSAGTFATSYDSSGSDENTKVNVTTTNYSGYTLKIQAGTTGNNANKLINSACVTTAEGSGGTIDGSKCYLNSLSAVENMPATGISAADYSAAANTQYNNTWAYLPSKHNSSANTNYLPMPNSGEDILDVTNSANAGNIEYTIAIGARVNDAAPSGAYTNTFVLIAVANPIQYTINYDPNASGGTVTNMPGVYSSTTGMYSYSGLASSTTANLNPEVPMRDGYIFAGWNTAAGGNGTQYQHGGSFGIDQTADDNTMTLYAQWKICEKGNICYMDNGANSVTTMGSQTVGENTTAMLWAPNYQRSGFGFAGWNTAADGSGAQTYGPNETLTSLDLSSSGLTLYAKWVAAAGNLQNWDGCTSLADGVVTALTDTRNNQTYAVAKLADGNCWMIENLRLGNTYQNNGTATPVEFSPTNTQGLGGVFIGLAGSETDNFGSSTTANSLYTTVATEGMQVIEGSLVDLRFPRYNGSNTTSTVSSMTGASQSVYSYGNYYTWAAAIANTSQFVDATAETSICPKGWRLPISDSGLTTTNLSFAKLDTALSSTAATWRAYPNNFVYSGNYIGDQSTNAGTTGYYWSGSSNSDGVAYRLSVADGGVSAGGVDTVSNKYYGYAVRCVMAPSNN